MRTKGLMGITVEKLTKGERDDMFALLDRMSQGVGNQSGGKQKVTPNATPLSDDYTYGESFRESAIPAAAIGAENVVMFSGLNNTVDHVKKAPHKAFPPEFYNFFEFVEDDVKFG